MDRFLVSFSINTQSHIAWHRLGWSALLPHLYYSTAITLGLYKGEVDDIGGKTGLRVLSELALVL